jgi:hypothetical protein
MTKTNIIIGSKENLRFPCVELKCLKWIAYLILYMIVLSTFVLMKRYTTKKYYTVRAFPKFNRKIVEKDKIDTPNTKIHGR